MFQSLARITSRVLITMPLMFGSAQASEMPEELAARKGPVETITEKAEDKRSERQKQRDALQAALDEKRKGANDRVLVLRFLGSDTDFRSEALRRNIRNRIGRPAAKFYPEIDMYQSGRKNSTIKDHRDQMGAVPDDLIFEMEDAATDASTIAWDGMEPYEWQAKAAELRDIAEKVWFIDREELRQPLFLLLTQIGRAAENAQVQSPPYYAAVGGRNVNYYYYLAGAMAHSSPALLSKLSGDDKELHAAIQGMKDQLDGGLFPFMTISFRDESFITNGAFDLGFFNGDYAIHVNGKEQNPLENEQGTMKVPLGRADIYLERVDDGFGLSAGIDLDKADDEGQFIVQDARDKMGRQFQEQLLNHRADCIPELDGDILNYLAIYARLHPEAIIYISIPEAGSTSAAKLLLWRWEREAQQLKKMLDTTGGFPVRFAALLGTGITFSGVDVTEPTPQRLVDAENLPDGQGGAKATAYISAVDFATSFTPESIPIEYQLRGHYNRLMFGIGIEYAFSLSGEKFADFYQTKDDNGNDGPVLGADQNICKGGVEWTTVGDGEDCPDGSSSIPFPSVAVKERNPRRFIYTMLGVMIGPDSSEGFGPRGFVRVGFMNVPHLIDVSLHAGYTGRLFGGKGGDKNEFDRVDRVRIIADADFWGGMVSGYGQSQFKTKEGFFALGRPAFNFGLTAMAGLTF